MTQGLEQYIPPLKAENINLDHLTKLPMDIVPLGPAYRGIHESLRRVNDGLENSAWFSIIGLYGSGKTLLLRRIAHESVERYDKIVPIYFYLGVKEEILLFRALENYISELDEYISIAQRGKLALPTRTRVHGSPEYWIKNNKIQALKTAVQTIRDIYGSSKEKSDVELFFEVMKELNKQGYLPLIIFDEFERLIYTGEGVAGSSAAVYNLYVLSEQFLELTRGHLFSGVGILALTDDISVLLRRASEEEQESPGKGIHVKEISKVAGVPYEQLKLASPNIVFSGAYRLNWSYENLDLLCKRLNILLPVDFLNVLSRILPTPRAVMSIAKRAHELGLNLAGKRDIFKLIRNRVEEFVNALSSQRTKDNRPLIYPTSAWDERFRTLLEHGYYVVKVSELQSIGQLFYTEPKDPKRAHSSGRNIMNTLLNYGLFERVGKEYMLRRELMAYFLEIERLPSGSTAHLEDVLEIVKKAVEGRRELARSYRERSLTGSEKSLRQSK